MPADEPRTPGDVPGTPGDDPPGDSIPRDPTRQRDQPALTTSTGLVWLVVGGILAAISLAVLIPMASLPGGTVAVAAAVVIALLYVGMIVTRFTVRPGRRRLGIMATSMLLIAAIALVATVLVAFSTAGTVPDVPEVGEVTGTTRVPA